MLRPIIAFVLAAAAATAPSLTGEEKPAAKAKPMLAGSELKDFKVVDEMKDHGPVTLKEGVLTLGAGMPLTGIVFTGKPENLPVQDYEVSFEARRTSGSDFFAALTFPVRDHKTCATLVVGGWGGQCVGISSINYMSADENETTNWIEFETDRWYRIRLAVGGNSLKGWIDDRVVFDVSIEDKKISMRFGDIELCQPFGLATYQTEGQVRNLQIKTPAPKATAATP